MQGVTVWISGLGSELSLNRRLTPLLEWHDISGLYTFNPLVNWNYVEVLSYLKLDQVPYNSLDEKGFINIGCAPCTPAIAPGDNTRAGRWWEQSQK